MARGVVTPGPPVVPQRRPIITPDPFNFADDEYLRWLAQGSPTPKSVNSAVAAGPRSQAIDAAPNLPLLYGTNRVKGQIMTASTGGVGQASYWIAISEGEIFNVDKLFVQGYDPSDIGLGAAYSVTQFKGSAAQAEDPVLAAYLGWSPGGLPGTAYVRVDITNAGGKMSWVYNIPGVRGTESAPTPPDITFEFNVRGRKVYDPRDDATNYPGDTFWYPGYGLQRRTDPTTWAWSDNPFLHWRDIRVLSGVENDKINDASIILAANNATTTFNGTTRFISNLACATPTNLKSYLDQLAIACNGYESWIDGKLNLFCDVENASAPVLTLNSTTNFSSINYNWIDRKDRPTQVRIDFRNKDIAATPYKEDYVLVPENLAADVEPVLASYTSAVITDRVHAARAASYIYNMANGTPFRAEGECTYEGINVLPRGTKVALETSEGVGEGGAVQHMLVDIARETLTGWHMTLRQYAEAIYRDVPVTETQPIGYEPPFQPEPTGPPAEVTCPTLSSAGTLTWRPSRLYGAGVTPALSGYGVWSIDLGTEQIAKMGRLKVDCVDNGGPVSISAVQWSDDGTNWTTCDHFTSWYGRGFAKTLRSYASATWWYEDWDTPANAHRYWRVLFPESALYPVGNYTVFLPVVSEVDTTITGYEIHNSNATEIALGTPSPTDPIYLAGDRLLNSADLSGMISFSGFSYCVPTIVAVRNSNERSLGVTLIANDVTNAPYVAAQSGSTVQQAGKSSDIGGTQKASVTATTDYMILDDPGTPPAVSAASTARVYFDGSAIQVSADGGAYAPLAGDNGVPPGALTSNWSAGNYNINSRNSTAWVNITAYGADPTGANSSSAAINDAIAALPANGGVVYAPPGTYKLATTITVSKSIRLLGDGYASPNPATVFVKANTLAGAAFFIEANEVSFENFLVDGNKAGGATGDGIVIGGIRTDGKASQLFSATNVNVKSNTGSGWNFGDDTDSVCNFWRLTSCNSSSNDGDGFVFDGGVTGVPTGPDMNAGVAVSCSATGNTGDGWRFKKAQFNTIVGGGSETNTGAGYHFMAGSLQNEIHGGDPEGNSGGDVLIDADAVATMLYGIPSGKITNNSTSTVGTCIFSDKILVSNGDASSIAQAPTTNGAFWDNLTVGQSTYFRSSSSTAADKTWLTVTPAGDVSFVGKLATAESNKTLANGANQDVAVTSSYVHVTGPTAGFSVGGVAAGVAGQIVTFWSEVNYTMTVNHADTGSTSTNRIRTSTQANVACGGTYYSWFTIQYSGAAGFWILLGHS